jgi:heptosyltransferase-3
MLKDAVNLKDIRRALIIQLRHHGDVLLTSPMFSVLKNHAPHIEVDALIYKDTNDMLSQHPSIAEVHHIDRKWKTQGIFQYAKAEWALLSKLRSREYDLVIHLTPHPRGAWLSRLIGPKYAVTPASNKRGKFWKNSFTHFYPAPKGTPRHRVELNLDALRRIGIYPEENEKALVLVPGIEASAKVKELLQKNNVAEKKFIHIHPTSRWFFKCWPEKKFAELINILQERGHTIVVSAAPASEELDMVKEILKDVKKPVVDFSGQLSLKQLAALTAQAKLFIGVDSAPMHIAAAVKTPTVALFGPSGDKEWGPWITPHHIVMSDKHPCRPCGNDGCGGSKVSECLTTLPVEKVLSAANSFLQNS